MIGMVQPVKGVTLRAQKGAPLTHDEMDLNFKILKIVGSFVSDVINAFVAKDELPLVADGVTSTGWYRVRNEDVGVPLAVSDGAQVEMFYTDDADTEDAYSVETGESGVTITFSKPGVAMMIVSSRSTGVVEEME